MRWMLNTIWAVVTCGGNVAFIGAQTRASGATDASVLTYTTEDLARAKRFTLVSPAIAILGGPESDMNLSHVTNVVVLSDGRIATFAPVGSQLLIFDREGTLRRRLGGVGRSESGWRRVAARVRVALRDADAR